MSLKTRIVTTALAVAILGVSAAGAFAHPYFGYPVHPSWWWFHHEHFHHFYGSYPYEVCFHTWHGQVCVAR